MTPHRPGRLAAYVRRQNLAHAEESGRDRPSQDGDDYRERRGASDLFPDAQTARREAGRRDFASRRLGGVADDVER